MRRAGRAVCPVRQGRSARRCESTGCESNRLCRISRREDFGEASFAAGASIGLGGIGRRGGRIGGRGFSISVGRSARRHCGAESPDDNRLQDAEQAADELARQASPQRRLCRLPGCSLVRRQGLAQGLGRIGLRPASGAGEHRGGQKSQRRGHAHGRPGIAPSPGGHIRAALQVAAQALDTVGEVLPGGGCLRGEKITLRQIRWPALRRGGRGFAVVCGVRHNG